MENIDKITLIQFAVEHMAKIVPSISGFDIKKLARASGQPANDPWRRQYVWMDRRKRIIMLIELIARHGDTQDHSR